MTQEEFQKRYLYNTSTDCLGRGGFGSVYRAWDTILSRYVAIKISPIDYQNPGLRLRNEVEKAVGLLHPNVAHYEECHTFSYPTGDFDFAIMQFYEDGSLDKFIINNALNLDDYHNILRQILLGIAFLHKNNIIHRDLKPQNILIVNHAGNYVPKITDFGISKRLNEGESSAVSNSVLGGTRFYASPEQLAERKIRKNSDLWSFGIIAYRLFTGTTPFNSGEYSATSEQGRQELFRQMMSGELPSRIDDIHEPWRSIIQKCLIPDNTLRVAHAEECLAILDQYAKMHEQAATFELAVPEDSIEEVIIEEDVVQDTTKPAKTSTEANENWESGDAAEIKQNEVASHNINDLKHIEDDANNHIDSQQKEVIDAPAVELKNKGNKKHLSIKRASRYIAITCCAIAILATIVYVVITPRNDSQIQTHVDYSEMLMAGLGRNGIYRVGDYYNRDSLEGVVFEVSDGGRHGKIISLNQSEKIYWCTVNEAQRQMSTGALSTDDGIFNTDTIVAYDRDLDRFPAFAWCKSLGDDWYLPSREEWETIREYHSVINTEMYRHNAQFNTAWYWTSSEYIGYPTYVWACGYPDHAPAPYKKEHHKTYVRAAAVF